MEQVWTLQERPERADSMRRLGREAWPEFLHHSDVEHWGRLFDELASYQLLLFEWDTLVGLGHAAPISWSGEWWDLPRTIEEILLRAVRPAGEGFPATDLCALAAVVDGAHRRRGMSRRIVTAMIELARRRGLRSLLAPVRPVEKAMHPFVPMEEYIGLTRPDGKAFDPWLRVHLDLGGTILGIAPATLRVEGTVRDWEDWTGMRFPATGSYAVPGALLPIRIDRGRDLGIYEEPNVWVRHEARG